MSPVLWVIFLSAAAFLVGGIPFSLLLVRWRTGIDLRTFGSGNIGATNARRAAGTAIGLAALVLDALKGALPTLAMASIAGHSVPAAPQGYAVIVAVAAVAGHMFPIYLLFRASGKGVATALGCFTVLAPCAVAAVLIVFIVTAAISRRISLGSLVACAVLPAAVWLATRDPGLLTGSIVIVALIITRHSANIRRIRQGTEPRF